MDKTLNKAVVQATEQIFRDLLMFKISAGDTQELPINHKDHGSSETVTIISFAGDISGALMLKCSTAVGYKIAERMLGADIEPDSDDMKDALGELLNMIIGSAKTFYSTENAFRLSLPTTIVGQNYSLYIKANTGKTLSHIPFRSGNAELGMEIYLK